MSACQQADKSLYFPSDCPSWSCARIKSLAASRGVTLQEAVHQALEAWASYLPPAVELPLDALQGSR